MNKEYEIRQAVNLVWRNLPNGVSTFGNCSTDGCEGSGRGSGKCIGCAEKQLADLTSGGFAGSYVEAVLTVRKIESDMVELYGG
jgi:hypothetical protein